MILQVAVLFGLLMIFFDFNFKITCYVYFILTALKINRERNFFPFGYCMSLVMMNLKLGAGSN